MWTKTCQWEKQLRRLFAGPQLALPISQRTDVHDPDLCDNRGLSRICSTTRAVVLQAPCTRSTPLTPAIPPGSTAIVLVSSVSTLPKQKVMAFSSLVDTTRHDAAQHSTAQHSTAQHTQHIHHRVGRGNVGSGGEGERRQTRAGQSRRRGAGGLLRCTVGRRRGRSSGQTESASQASQERRIAKHMSSK